EYYNMDMQACVRVQFLSRRNADMKATKRLLSAVAALVASIVFCVGVCLAWFAITEKVDGNGMHSEVRGINIQTFTVTAYKLTETDGVYIKGDALTGSAVRMESYGGLNPATTALLLEISYSFYTVEGKNYNVYAKCNKAVQSVSPVEGGDDLFECNLSDAVRICEATVEGSSVTLSDGEAKSFFSVEETADGSETVKSDMLLNGRGLSDGTGDQTVKLYFVIDYYDLYVNELYALILNNGGTLNSAITFTGEDDIGFYMQEETVL
ncbi:MAG: hypothetical protein K2L72_06285, partial [Clostridia bacterium]|nr:hypothetical protein [Clostridia bacterium]